MKEVRTCIVENCIPTPTSCGEWNGGDIAYLGICQGDSLNKVIWEIIDKLENITGEDLSNFDIDSLTTICKINAPQEITILSILNTLKDNQICLKEFIDGVNERLNEAFKEQAIEINLGCYSNLDNMGNALNLTRKSLDQLVVNNLCNHKKRIESLEQAVKNLEEDEGQAAEPSEVKISTCLDGAKKAVSSQVIKTTEEFCDLRTATGNPEHIAIALSRAGENWNTKYASLAGWNNNVSNQADLINNLVVIIKNLEARVSGHDKCCATTCEDIKVGFSAMFNEDASSIILKFSSGAGTTIPEGFVDKGSTGTITDEDGNIEDFSIGISNNLEQEVFIYNLNTKGSVIVNINAKIGSDALVCEKCVSRTVRSSTCAYCELTATGQEGSSAVIIYHDPNSSSTVSVAPINQILPSTTTTTTTPV